MSSDDSEETRAQRQRLSEQIDESKQNLTNQQYDKYLSDQQDLLDDLFEQYSDTLNARLEDTDALIEDMIDSINANSSSISETLKSETAKVGIDISKSMNDIWTKEDNALKLYLDDDSSLLGGFRLDANGYFKKMGSDESGVLTSLGGIAGGINGILEYASQIAKTEEESDYNKQQMIQNSKDWWGADDDTKAQLEKENEIYGDSLGYTKGEDGVWRDNDGDPVYTISIDDKVRSIVSKMKQNSADWHVSDEDGQTYLEGENEKLAEQIENLTGKQVRMDGDGVWWIGNKELYKKYASGGLADYTGLAWLDGTPSKPELVLSPKDTENFISLKDYLATAAKKGLFNPSGIYTTDFASKMLPEAKFERNVITSTMGDVNFSIAIDHVEDYNDFVNQLRKDRQFEKMVQSMTVDQLAGRSSLAKNKYKW